MDGNIPQHYEIKQPGGVISPQEQLNKQLEEQRKVIIKGMDDDLRSGRKYEQIKGDLKYEVVGNIGVVIYKGAPNSFYKYSRENGVEYLMNIPGMGKDEDTKFGEKETGYKLKDGKLFIGGKELPQFLTNGHINPEFVRGVDDISFYGDIQHIFGSMKAIINGKKLTEFSVEEFYASIVRGVSRIKEVLYFAGKGYIPQKEVPRLLKRAIAELPNQCSDMRFVRNPKGQDVGMEVTKQELDEYLHPTQGAPLITQKVYNDCLKRIEARDRKIQEEQKLKEGTRGEIKIEKERKSFSDRAMEILRGIF